MYRSIGLTLLIVTFSLVFDARGQNRLQSGDRLVPLTPLGARTRASNRPVAPQASGTIQHWPPAASGGIRAADEFQPNLLRDAAPGIQSSRRPGTAVLSPQEPARRSGGVVMEAAPVSPEKWVPRELPIDSLADELDASAEWSDDAVEETPAEITPTEPEVAAPTFFRPQRVRIAINSDGQLTASTTPGVVLPIVDKCMFTDDADQILSASNFVYQLVDMEVLPHTQAATRRPANDLIRLVSGSDDLTERPSDARSRVLVPLNPFAVQAPTARPAAPSILAPNAAAPAADVEGRGGLLQDVEFDPVRDAPRDDSIESGTGSGPVDLSPVTPGLELPLSEPAELQPGFAEPSGPSLVSESYINGQVKLEGEVLDGQPHGHAQWWHPNGQLAMHGEFIDGQPHGEWACYYPNGQRAIVGKYDGGTPIGRWSSWNQNGRVLQTRNVTPPQRQAVEPRLSLDRFF